MYDSTQQGSSKLLWFTGMGDHTMRYDVLGNLTTDSSRSLYLLEYDYRNLMNYVKMSSGAGAGANDRLYMVYDHTGQRVEKCYRRYYLVNCDNTKPGGGSANPKMESMSGSRPEEAYRFAEQAGAEPEVDAQITQCLVYQDMETFYLFDNGVLLATFDQRDSVIELMVNGPGGMIASYHENDDDLLYYFITDQIGSPRVIMAAAVGAEPQVTRYINYHPFGQVHQSWGGFDTPFKFTGKELDEERDFEFHYFGARYYDARIGAFSSIDKASQFSGGYLYGENNPILLVDPNGNVSIFGLEIKIDLSGLFESAGKAAEGYVNYGMNTGDWGTNALGYGIASSYVGFSTSISVESAEAPLVPGEQPRPLGWGYGEIYPFDVEQAMSNAVQAKAMDALHTLFYGRMTYIDPETGEEIPYQVGVVEDFGAITGVGKGSIGIIKNLKNLPSTLAEIRSSLKSSVKLLQKPKMVKHHLFNKFRGQSPNSAKYREFFGKHGIDIDAFTVEITEDMHKSIIHKASNNWTTKMKKWIDTNPDVTTREVYQQIGKMMDEYGLSHLPIQPY